MERFSARTSLLIQTLLLLLAFSVEASSQKNRIINGTPVTSGFKEVVLIDTTAFKCSGTFVGPRVVLTAGACVSSSDGRANVTVNVNGQSLTAEFIASTASQHDMAVAIVAQDVSGITPMTVGGTAKTADMVTMLGYGCTVSGKPQDGVLTSGETQVKTVDNSTLTTNKSGGAAVCFWDSGGPVYLSSDTTHSILGISSHGEVTGTSYITRTDSSDSQAFLKKIASEHSVKICGVNLECGAVNPKPTCALTSSAPSIKQGETMTITMTTTGPVTSASIDGTAVTFPPGTKVFTPAAAGSFIAKGSVSGPGGNNICEIGYQVTPPAEPAPTCTLSANPTEIALGAQVTLSLSTQGSATSATIEGTSAKFPLDTKIIIPSATGDFTAKATVVGPGGSNACEAKYKVTNATPNKPICTLSATPNDILVGGLVTLKMTTIGDVTSATLEGGNATFPEMTKVITPPAPGVFTAVGTVTGPGGSNNCKATYSVKDDPGQKPTCQLTANPDEIELGKSLILSLTSKGNVTAATIDGASVSVPNGQREIKPGAAGTFNAQGSVTGPTGNGACQVTYRVNNGPSPDKPSCTVTVSPPSINLGNPVLMTLLTQGNVTSAVLDGAYVDFPVYKKTKTPTSLGLQNVKGSVEGPTGSSGCQATLEVLP